MPGTNRNLSLMLFPQRWDGANLVANLLLLPNGDPTATVPLTTGSELAFAAAQPALRAALLPGLGTPAWDPSVTPAMLNFVSVPLAYSSSQAAIFSGLLAEYTPSVPTLVQAAGTIRKDLPHSYLEATGFQTPDADLFTAIDGFGCALQDAVPNQTPVTPRPIAWGEIISYALRQPLLAQAMGLMYLQVNIPLTPAQVQNGGWIWLEIDTTSNTNWYASLVNQNAQAVVSYAARLPMLTTPQDVFAAVLFPTVSANYDSSTLDAAQLEADLYLDGFAKVVHANQPATADSVTQGNSIVPGTDAGIQIGWDDEQVTTWINRQVQIAQAMASATPPTTPIAELPFTVLGYRVDVREHDYDSWSSLCAANGTLNAAGAFTASYTAQDLCVEPTPVQNGGANQDYWLPQYFAQWRGRTLVINDQYGYVLSGGQPQPAPATPPPSDFTGTQTESLSGVDLCYGHDYQFRARLADLTGGGPSPVDPNPSDAGIATIPFRRHVPPKKVPLTLGDVASDGTRTLTVDRPSINYPEMVFCGAADQGALDALMALIPPMPPVGTKPYPAPPAFQAALLDPDVTTLEIIVEAKAPKFDTGDAASLADAGLPPAPGDLDDTFRVVYTWQVPYSDLATPVAVDASTPIQLTLVPTLMAHIDNPVLPSSARPTFLPIPTGRNIRLRLRGIGDPDPNELYYGSSVARTGLIADLSLRFESPAEANLLAPGSVDQQLQAFYLNNNLDQATSQELFTVSILETLVKAQAPLSTQDYLTLTSTLNQTPSTPLALLASALNLPVDGQTIAAPPGRRILFGAQSSLRHTLPQDRSSITFSTQKDLVNHWIVVQRFTVDRDWTWSGLASAGFTFTKNPEDGSLTPLVLGSIDMPPVVSPLATQQLGEPGQRDTTEIIFFSTLDSSVPPNEFPAPTSGSYQLHASYTGNSAPVQLWNADITVPITAIPAQVPRLVSAGIAESPYIAADDYSSTTQRQRALWFEFDQPPADANDSYFVRIANYGPDPLLISSPTDLQAVQDTPIPLDPEPIRMITPDSVNDDAGLAAMTRMQRSGTSDVHYLIPLPPGISPAALDLFGFWTYEIRVGHLQWSTAQGRFGRPFRVSGVQHPCPPLVAAVERVTTIPSGGSAAVPCILASAELAQTVLNGSSLTLASAPQTQIWFLLYAQLRRADGQAYRNLLLGKLRGVQAKPTATIGNFAPPTTPAITVSAAFPQTDVDAALAALRLPYNTPLSILAVELFNREDLVIDETVDVPRAVEATLLTGQPGISVTSTSKPKEATGNAVAPHATAQAVATPADPLGQQIGSQRILRTSPLTPVRDIC